MAISYLDIAGTYSGPGAYNYNVAAWPGGATLFVNSATGADSRGRVKFMGTPSQSGVQPISANGPIGDPQFPLASVFGTNGAISFCKAGRGDTVIVAPGHTETLATGAGITIPAGVTVIGGGYGSARPAFQFTNAATFLTCSGAGLQLQNLIFDLTGVATLTKGFLFSTGGVQFCGVRIIQASATNQATDAIVLNAGADDFLFNGSEIDASAAAGAARGISNPAANNINRLLIINSFIHGDYSGAPISLKSTSTKEFLIEYNTLRNYNAAFGCVDLAAGNTITGIISNNDIMMAGTGQTTFILNGGGTGMALLQNFAWDTKAATASGILIPAAGTL